MYCLVWLWVAFSLFFSGEILSSILIILLGTVLYFVIFKGFWKRKKKHAATRTSNTSDSNSFWNLYISDSGSDSSSADSDSGGEGGGGGY